MLVVGFAGRAGSGKNEAANIAAKAFRRRGYLVVQMAFADAVKDIYKVIFNEDPYTNDRVLKEQTIIPGSAHKTMRRILQIIGTEFGREMIDPHIWINIVAQRIVGIQAAQAKKKQPRPIAVFITDVRESNEALFVTKTMNGLLIDMLRNEPKQRWWNKLFHRYHRSEAVEYRKDKRIRRITVDNEGDLATLKESMEFVVNQIFSAMRKGRYNAKQRTTD